MVGPPKNIIENFIALSIFWLENNLKVVMKNFRVKLVNYWTNMKIIIFRNNQSFRPFFENMTKICGSRELKNLFSIILKYYYYLTKRNINII